MNTEASSSIPDAFPPYLVGPKSALLATLTQKLEKSQWWSADEMRAHQYKLLERLLLHAWKTTPFYRARLEQAGWSPGKAIADEVWQRIPLLRRQDIQDRPERIRSSHFTRSQEGIRENQTSGSTGEPVKYLGTPLTRLMWLCVTARHCRWHIKDLSGKLCVVRAEHGPVIRDGREFPSWGAVFGFPFETGPYAATDCRQDAAEILDWLMRQDVHHLVIYPSTLEALMRSSADTGRKPLRLRSVSSYAEVLKPEVRQLVRDVWELPVLDMYCSREVGYVALQCPEGEQYHIQSENLLVEVLDDENRPCFPGQTGKLVLTTLHNFASPLIRYEIRDYAEVGEPCSCGRSLPVITRVMGRVRNLMTLPDGRRYWPPYFATDWGPIAPIRQLQLVQKTARWIEVRLVMDRELNAAEQARFTDVMSRSLGHPFNFTFRYQQEPIVFPNGKYESFVSEIGQQAVAGSATVAEALTEA